MLTDTEARNLLHQAADTIEIGPATPFATPPPKRGYWLPVVAAAVLVLVVVGGMLVWRTHQPVPVDRPHSPVTIPATVGYPTRFAVSLLRQRGLEPEVHTRTACRDRGRAIETRPSAGTAVSPGSRVVLVAATTAPLPCPSSPTNAARDEAWQLVDLARGVGSPAFADQVELSVDKQPSVTVSGFDATDPANWPVCNSPHCPGTALDAIRSQLEESHIFLEAQPRPRPWLVGSASSAITFYLDYPKDGIFPLPWTIQEYVDSDGNVMAVHLSTRRTFGITEPPSLVGHDPTGIARHFVDFADGLADSPPVDTPVRLYLGHRYVRTLSSDRASDREAWSVCRPGYAAATCPFSAIDTLREYVDSRGRLRVTPPPSRDDPSCLALLGGPPKDTGGNHVIAIEPEHKSCVDTFEIDVYSNDVGQIVAVDLLLGEP
jgi:hypothetical protein